MSGTARSPRWEGAVDNLSFSATVRELVETLNREMEAPHKLEARLPSHPQGFLREISKRRLNIAECYLRLATLTAPEAWRERLDALRMLVDLAMHAKTLSMPLNTARVQVALMKRCVESRGDRRRQLELMSDFALASHGQTPVIRRLLGELDLVEVPEDGRPLRDVGPGWDDHVHDAFTEGHETPAQLLLDAFIKGIARLTVAYYDLSDSCLYRETLRAGEILGIDVEVGVEFSVGPALGRLGFLYVPPGAGSLQELEASLAAHREALAPFLAGLEANAVSRRGVIQTLLDTFNGEHLKALNAEYRDQPFLQIGRIGVAELEAQLPARQASRLHLGQLLWNHLRQVLHRRVLFLKNQLSAAVDEARGRAGTSWEVEQLQSRYRAAREEYQCASPTRIQERFLHTRAVQDYDSVFATLEDVLPALAATGGRIALIHPLSRGAQPALHALVEGHPWLTGVEVFNLADASFRTPLDVQRLARFLLALQAGEPAEVLRQAASWGVVDLDPGVVAAACAFYREQPLRPRCGSDYVGANERVAGMGFATSPTLGPRNLKALVARHHASVGGSVGALLLERLHAGEELRAGEGVYLLSQPPEPRVNRVGDEPVHRGLPARRIWRYLNLRLKFLVKVGIGLVPAITMVGPGYAALWFVITGGRNVAVDMVSSAGLSMRGWRWRAVDMDNLANSLFWTGFSVPILAAVKHGFDLGWPLLGPQGGFVEALAKFWVIAFANGLYLSSHNRLRGFDAKVIRGNFFRTVLSWPLAAVGSYALGPLGIPAIVQAKFWSDVVAGAVEGSGKYLLRMRRTRQWMLEILLNLADPDPLVRRVARADLLVVWARRHQGRQVLARLLRGRATAGAEQEHWDVPDPATLALARDRLLRASLAEGSQAELTAMILTHFHGGTAAQLCDLVARYHAPFKSWLGGVQAKAPAEDTAEVRKPGPG